jgi:hypothetical protein
MTFVCLAAVACASGDTTEDAGATVPSVGTLSPVFPAATATPPPNPFITDTGIRVPLAVDFPDSGFKICEADAYVRLQYGKVVDVTLAPPSFKTAPGEETYLPTGEASAADDPTLVTQPVYRDSAGHLVA